MQLLEPQTEDKAAVCIAAQCYSHAKSSAGTTNTATILPGGHLHSIVFCFLNLDCALVFLLKSKQPAYISVPLLAAPKVCRSLLVKEGLGIFWTGASGAASNSLMSGVCLTLLFHIQTLYQSTPPTTETPVHSCHVLLMTRLQCVAKEV